MPKNLFTKGYTPWNKGKKLPPLSEKLKQKIKQSNLGQKRSQETIEKIRISKTGVKYPNRKKPKSWAKIRYKICAYCGKSFAPQHCNYLRNRFCSKSCSSKSHPSGRTGKKNSEHSKMMMSLRMKGEKHPNWINDRTQLKDDRKDRGGQFHREWSNMVKKRDFWKCRINNCDCFGKVVAHHILSWKEYPELRYVVENGITLCKRHHPLKREDEKTLIPIFQSMINKI